MAVTEAEYKSKFKLTIGSPYLALKGELWGVYSGDLGEIVWYRQIIAYIVNMYMYIIIIGPVVERTHEHIESGHHHQ